MTLYSKPRSDVFASNAPQSEIKDFTAWLRGLGIAFDETNGLPEMEGLNNVFNLLNQYIKYLEQNGFAEWSSDLEYPIGAGVRVGAVWYRAKAQNTSKPPATSQNDWELFLNANALTYENPLYIENNVVKVRNASQSQSGVVQFASEAEIVNKANVSKVVNPSQAFSIGFGVGQTWRNVTSIRAIGSTYTNNTGKPIKVSIICAVDDGISELYINNELISKSGNTGSSVGNNFNTVSEVIPIGFTYRYQGNSFLKWSELS